jgi:hypothetical protein
MEPTIQFLLTALAILSIPCIGLLILIAFIVIGIPLARKHRQRWDEAWVETPWLTKYHLDIVATCHRSAREPRDVRRVA